MSPHKCASRLYYIVAQFGAPAGLFLANLAVLRSARCPATSSSAWGWRVPFWASIVMVAIGLYIRLGIVETPTFSRLVAENRIEKAPALESSSVSQRRSS
jgi:MFS family permease